MLVFSKKIGAAIPGAPIFIGSRRKSITLLPIDYYSRKG